MPEEVSAEKVQHISTININTEESTRVNGVARESSRPLRCAELHGFWLAQICDSMGENEECKFKGAVNFPPE